MKTKINDNTKTEVETLTPTEYFERIKGLKQFTTDEDILRVQDKCLEFLNGAKKTGQTALAKDMYERMIILFRELQAIKAGYQTYVLKDDIVYYIQNIAKNPVKIIELSEYKRILPDEVIDRISVITDIKYTHINDEGNEEEYPLFDEFFVVFTDYTGEVERTVEKEKRDKDPILFGAIYVPNKNKVPSSRLYYIADWVDEYCDLTLDQLCDQYRNHGGEKKNILYINTIPQTKTETKDALNGIADDYKLH